MTNNTYRQIDFNDLSGPITTAERAGIDRELRVRLDNSIGYISDVTKLSPAGMEELSKFIFETVAERGGAKNKNTELVFSSIEFSSIEEEKRNLALIVIAEILLNDGEIITSEEYALLTADSEVMAKLSELRISHPKDTKSLKQNPEP